MSTVPPQLLTVHELLSRYVAVHNAIFKFSWRKLLPIPSVFKPIPYDRYSAELAAVTSALEEAANSLRLDHTTPSIYTRYAEALLETVRILNCICQNLDRESQGNIGSYKYHAYRGDLARYHSA